MHRIRRTRPTVTVAEVHGTDAATAGATEPNTASSTLSGITHGATRFGKSPGKPTRTVDSPG